MTISNDALKIYEFGENLQHFNLDFENVTIHSRLKDFDKAVPDSGLSIKLSIRGEEHYVLNHPQKGAQEFIISPGKFLIINKHQQFNCFLRSDEEVEGFCLYLGMDIMNEVYQKLTESSASALGLNCPKKQAFNFLERIYALSENELGSFLQDLINQYQKTSNFEALTSQEFYYTLAEKLILSQCKINQQIKQIPSAKAATRKELYLRLSNARNYIFDNYTKNVQLDDLSKVAFLSKYHLLRTYKQIFGITPYQQVLQLRLEKAKDLVNKNYSLEEVAFQLGFSDRRSFTKAFKKTYLMSPSAFRKQAFLL